MFFVVFWSLSDVYQDTPGGSGDTGMLLWPFTLPIAVESTYSLLRLP